MAISPDVCRELLAYDPETGRLTWQERPSSAFKHPKMAEPWNRRYAGRDALNVIDKRWGHKKGVIFTKALRAHQVVWAIAHGRWPTGQIDHINGNPADNRISNLREASPRENCCNKRRYANNRSGRTGVRWMPQRSRWVGSIKDADGVQRHLGCFLTMADASEARRQAEVRLGYHPNHGRAA